MGSEVSNRTVLQDETFCVLRSANIRCVTGLALSTFCTTSRSTSEVSSSSTSKPSAWNITLAFTTRCHYPPDNSSPPMTSTEDGSRPSRSA